MFTVSRLVVTHPPRLEARSLPPPTPCQAHAVDTYAEFMDANEAALRDLPPPEIALAYYECGGERGGDDGICDVLDAPIGSPDDVSKPNPK